MNRIQNNPPKKKEDEAPADNGADSSGPERIAATNEDYLAVQLHQARADCNDLRKALVAEKETNLKLRAAVAKLEIAAVERDNTELRKQHGLEMGRTIHRDDATGEVWWEQEKAK
jgi:hypothetical protein